MMQSFKILDLPTRHDARGSLTVLENELPFSVERMFWIYGADGQTRGGHRHHVTRMGLVALAGSVTVLIDDGINRSEIVLNDATRCLILEPHEWHTMSFAQDSVLLVLASHPYNPADYIHEPYLR